MPLYTYGGTLLRSGGGLTADGDCCCGAGEPCSCAIEATPLAGCECVTSAYNTTFGTTAGATVTITGTTPQGANSGVGACSKLITCCDITGTYVLDCNEAIEQCCYTFICTDSGDDVYAYVFLTIEHTGEPTGDSVIVDIRSGTIRFTSGTAVTTGSLVSCVSGGTIVGGVHTSRKVRRYVLTPTSFLPLWQFVLGGSCVESCNAILSQRACGSPLTVGENGAAALTDGLDITESGCDVTVLNFSVAGR